MGPEPEEGGHDHQEGHGGAGGQSVDGQGAQERLHPLPRLAHAEQEHPAHDRPQPGDPDRVRPRHRSRHLLEREADPRDHEAQADGGSEPMAVQAPRGIVGEGQPRRAQEQAYGGHDVIAEAGRGGDVAGHVGAPEQELARGHGLALALLAQRHHEGGQPHRAGHEGQAMAPPGRKPPPAQKEGGRHPDDGTADPLCGGGHSAEYTMAPRERWSGGGPGKRARIVKDCFGGDRR